MVEWKDVVGKRVLLQYSDAWRIGHSETNEAVVLELSPRRRVKLKFDGGNKAWRKQNEYSIIEVLGGVRVSKNTGVDVFEGDIERELYTPGMLDLAIELIETDMGCPGDNLLGREQEDLDCEVSFENCRNCWARALLEEVKNATKTTD